MKARAILTDAMGTIFTFRGGVSKYDVHAMLFQKHGNRVASAGDIKRVYDAVRAHWEDRLPANHGQKWSFITMQVFLGLWPGEDPLYAQEIGRRCSGEFLSNTALYEVVPDTITFLREANECGIRVIMASNQDQWALEHIAERLGVFHFLGPWIYTSTEIGAEKPDPAFFQAIFASEELQPHECIMVGNNPKNDVAAANTLGMTGVLYDPQNAYPAFEGPKVRLFTELWGLQL